VNVAKPGLRFTATIGIIGINPHVIVPDEIVQALLAAAGKKALPVPVAAVINKTGYTANVVRYAGAPRLYLHGVVRKEAGVDVGDSVTVALAYDPKPRVRPAPPELLAALADNPEAKAAWEALAPSHRKEYVAYLDHLKSKEALARNVERTIAMLLSKRKPFR
jgi:hypothetical protein